MSYQSLMKLLVDAKDVVSLMVDLAYSALLLNNAEIAQQVLSLEEQMDQIYEKAQKLIIRVAMEEKDERKAVGLLRLLEASERIADAATRMADLVVRGLKPHGVYEAALKESEEVIECFRVERGSPLDGKTLGELRVQDETGMRIIAIKRGDHWLFNPRGDTPIEDGDLLIARGFAGGVPLLKKLVTKG